MLLHSHNNEIKLLPALPDQWPEGYVRGIRARGDYTIDISWKDGKLVEATLRAGKNTQNSVRIVYGKKALKVSVTPGRSAVFTKNSF